MRPDSSTEVQRISLGYSIGVCVLNEASMSQYAPIDSTMASFAPVATMRLWAVGSATLGRVSIQDAPDCDENICDGSIHIAGFGAMASPSLAVALVAPAMQLNAHTKAIDRR